MSERSPSMIEPVDDWLDAALRAEAADHRGDYLADGGFTARVMADLPAPATPPAWRKRAVMGIWAAAMFKALVRGSSIRHFPECLRFGKSRVWSSRGNCTTL